MEDQGREQRNLEHWIFFFYNLELEGLKEYFPQK